MITGIILASGFSKRIKEEKLLLKVEGVPLVERVIRAAQTSLIDELILVYRRDVIKEIGRHYDLQAVYNPHAERGQSEAVKVGIAHFSSRYRNARWQEYGSKSAAKSLCTGKHGHYGAVGVGNMGIAFQRHRHADIAAMSPEQLLSQPPVAEIVSDPVNGPARRNSFNLFGQ